MGDGDTARLLDASRAGDVGAIRRLLPGVRGAPCRAVSLHSFTFHSPL